MSESNSISNPLVEGSSPSGRATDRENLGQKAADTSSEESVSSDRPAGTGTKTVHADAAPAPRVEYRSPWYSLNGYRARTVIRADGSKGTELEHRLVAEEILGRKLGPDEHVHHRNESKADNRPENLEVLTRAEHCRHHFATGRTMVDLVCQGCGAAFRRDVRRRGSKYCSRVCLGRAAGQASGRARAVPALPADPAVNDASAERTAS